MLKRERESSTLERESSTYERESSTYERESSRYERESSSRRNEAKKHLGLLGSLFCWELLGIRAQNLIWRERLKCERERSTIERESSRCERESSSQRSEAKKTFGAAFAVFSVGKYWAF